jgi:cell division transport system permease protein
MKWLSYQYRALAVAARRLFAQPLVTLLTALALGVAISLPAGLYLVLDNVERLAGSLPTQPEISVYLAPDAEAAQRNALAAALRKHPRIAAARFVPRDEALKTLAESYGLADVIDSLDKNPLPDAWIVIPRVADGAALTALKAELQKLPGVAEVQTDSAWAERLAAALALGKTVVMLLATLFGIALVAISGNAIRALILTKRDEIEVSRLIGATDRYIRRPFLFLGALQGFFGGLMAVGVLAVAGMLLRPAVGRLAALYGSQYQLRPPSLIEIGIVLAATTLLGVLGAWLAVAHTLRQVEPPR